MRTFPIIISSILFAVSVLAGYEVKTHGVNTTIKHDGQVIKTVNNSSVINKENIKTIESLIQNIQDEEENTKSTVATLRSMGMEELAVETETRSKETISTIESAIKAAIGTLK
jgi:predicted DNA-binding ribbon-helix-helix protein